MIGIAILEAQKLSELVKKVVALPIETPVFVLETAADAIGWQKIRVLRALAGRQVAE